MTQKFHHIVGRDGIEPYFDLAVSDTMAPAKELSFRMVGVCLRGPQNEYGVSRRGISQTTETLICDVVHKDQFQRLEIDTVLSPQNAAAAIHTKFPTADLILTTRMHGAFLSLAAGKPVIAINQVPGEAKVSAVLGKTGWPFVFQSETLSAETITSAVAQLRTGDWRDQVMAAQRKIRQQAIKRLRQVPAITAWSNRRQRNATPPVAQRAPLQRSERHSRER